MWFDYERHEVNTMATDDPAVALEPELLELLRSIDRVNLEIVLVTFSNAEEAVRQWVTEWAAGTTVELEAAFVDRPLDGEARLIAPQHDGFNPIALGASLHAQLFRLPERWALDVCGAAIEALEALIAEDEVHRPPGRAWRRGRTTTARKEAAFVPRRSDRGPADTRRG